MFYRSTCHERTLPVRSESGPSWQVATGYRDINTAKAVVGTLQKWPTKTGGRSTKGTAVAGTTVYRFILVQKLISLFQIVLSIVIVDATHTSLVISLDDVTTLFSIGHICSKLPSSSSSSNFCHMALINVIWLKRLRILSLCG